MLEVDDEGGRMFLRVLIHLTMHDYAPLVSGALQLLFKHFSQRQEAMHTFEQVLAPLPERPALGEREEGLRGTSREPAGTEQVGCRLDARRGCQDGAALQPQGSSRCLPGVFGLAEPLKGGATSWPPQSPLSLAPGLSCLMRWTALYRLYTLSRAP